MDHISPSDCIAERQLSFILCLHFRATPPLGNLQLRREGRRGTMPISFYGGNKIARVHDVQRSLQLVLPFRTSEMAQKKTIKSVANLLALFVFL